MWDNIKDSEFFLSFTQDHDMFEICVTDFISVWTVFYSIDAFIARLKESNEGLELANDHAFFYKGLHMLSNLDKVKKAIISKEDNGNSLFVYLRIMIGFPFCFRCTLTKGSEELLFTKVTQPLLKTVDNLRSSQSELRHLLIKKDKEIEEYKSEGGEIVLRHLKTKAFNDLEHMNQFETYEENFGSADIPTSLLEKSFDSPLNNNMKNRPTPAPSNAIEEPVCAKEEPVCASEEPVCASEEPVCMKEELVDIKQELVSTEEEPDNIKQESVSIKEEPLSIKQEPLSMQEEPLSIKQDPLSIKEEPLGIKQEQKVPKSEEPTAPIIPSASCKQEIKTEWQSNETTYSNPRKRMKKLNY